MKIVRSLPLLSLVILICVPVVSRAQDEPRAAWQVSRFDITARAAERALSARALLTLLNVGRGAGSTVTLRISARAEVKSVSVNDANAPFRSQPEPRISLQRIIVTLPAPVAPNAGAIVTVDYQLPVAENSGLAAISPLGTQFLPLSFWYPSPNPPTSLRGADTAPVRLTIEHAPSELLVSSGEGASAGGTSFETRLYAQPFFLTGNWDVDEGAGDARGISVWLPRGASAEERKQADAIIGLASSARAFFTTLLGAAPETQVRVVAVNRGAGFNDAGALLLDAAALRRTKIDSVTALQVAETIARLWLGGATAVRGEGLGVLREGLTRFISTLFIEKQFGREASEAMRTRERIAYTAVARRDAPLSQSTPLDETYFSSVTNKGAMVWRLVDRALGRDALMAVLRNLLQAGKSSANGLTLAAVRAVLLERGGQSVKSILDQELDQPTDMDLLVGLPQQRGGQWVAALRNLGSLDATVTVAATTDRGEHLTTDVTIPARNFSEAVFKTSARIVRVEVDPDKLYPQLDYTNDVAPRASLSEAALAEAARAFGAQDFARAETIARELLAISPHMEEARIILARALLGQNKMAEAEKEFRAALDERLPTPATLAWANIGLGEISLRRGQAAEAARHFNEAVRADAEYASTLAARNARIKAEAAAPPAPDDSARSFIAQLDQAIKGGRKTEIEALIVPGELVKFIKGIVSSQPEVWQTRVLRTEPLGADRLAADVSLNTRELGRDQSGTAVLILARTGSAWKLADIQFFEVR